MLCDKSKKRGSYGLLEEQKSGHLTQSSLVSCTKGYLSEPEGQKRINQVAGYKPLEGTDHIIPQGLADSQQRVDNKHFVTH